MGKIIGNNRKQLLYGDAVDPGKCIYIARSWNVEVVCLLAKCDKQKHFDYREEEIPDCDCIYG